MVVLIISRVILLKLDFWCSYLRTKVMRAACARTEKNCTDFERHNKCRRRCLAVGLTVHNPKTTTTSAQQLTKHDPFGSSIKYVQLIDSFPLASAGKLKGNWPLCQPAPAWKVGWVEASVVEEVWA
jgi:hypothetical protein